MHTNRLGRPRSQALSVFLEGLSHRMGEPGKPRQQRRAQVEGCPSPQPVKTVLTRPL